MGRFWSQRLTHDDSPSLKNLELRVFTGEVVVQEQEANADKVQTADVPANAKTSSSFREAMNSHEAAQ